MSGIDHLYVDRSSQYVNWQENTGLSEADRARVQRGDLGQIQELTQLDDGSFRVKTELGTLTLSGPALDEVRDQLSVNDYIQTTELVGNIPEGVVVDMTAILKLLAQTNIEKRKVDRQVREADRDMAMAESYNAASEIRKGALFNLIFGCVSGAINIGMGAMSAVGTFKSLGQLKSPMQDVKLAQAEVKTTQAEINMQQARVDVAKQQQVVEAKQTALTEAETKVQTTQEKANLAEAEVKTKQENVAKLEKQLQEAPQEQKAGIQKQLDEAKGQLKTAQDNNTLAQKELTEAKTVRDEAQTELDTAKADLGKKQEALTKAEKTYKTELDNLTKLSEAGVKRADQRVKDAEKPGVKEKLGLEKPRLTRESELTQATSDQVTKQSIFDQAKTDQANLKKMEPITPKNAKEIQVDAQKALDTAQARLGDPMGLKPGPVQQRLNDANTAFNSAVTLAQTKATFYQSVGQIGSGAAQISGSVGQTIEQTSQANAKEHDAQADKVKAAAEDLTADMQTSADILRDVKECLESIRQSNNQAFQSILQA